MVLQACTAGVIGPSQIFFFFMDKSTSKLVRDGLKGLHLNVVKSHSHNLPDFVIIGAAKSATTTLVSVLRTHPDVFVIKPKEPKFFGKNYSKGWEWYASRFAKGGNKKVRGEASTMYSSHMRSYRSAPELMHRYLPDLKLIYIVRHPLDRIVSHWRHLKGRDQGIADFDALLQDRSLKRRVVGSSMYYKQLSRYRAFFSDEQIHCMTFEDLLLSPKSSLQSVLKFLGVKPRLKLLLNGRNGLPLENKVGAKGRAYVDMPEWNQKLRKKLLLRIRPDSEKFLSYMGKSADYWNF